MFETTNQKHKVGHIKNLVLGVGEVSDFKEHHIVEYCG